MAMDWHKRLEAKREIVREFAESLTDTTLIKICYLYMQGYDDKGVMKELKLTEFALSSYKDQLAAGLQAAGIEPRK